MAGSGKEVEAKLEEVAIADSGAGAGARAGSGSTDIETTFGHGHGHGVQRVSSFEKKIFGTLGGGHYEVFNQDWKSNDLELYLEETTESKIRPRLVRIFLFILIPPLLFGLFQSTEIKHLSTHYGIGLLCVFTSYFIHLFSILFGLPTLLKCCECRCFDNINCRKNDKDKNKNILGRHKHDRKYRTLFRIYSVNGFDDCWTEQAFTYRALLFRNHPIKSISEFSAIQGNFSGSMLLSISLFSYIVIVCEVIAEVHFNNFKFSLSDYFELIGMFGLVLIGSFELDPFVKTMRIIHNIGAALGTFTLFGFLVQQIVINNNENNVGGIVSSIFLGIIAFIAFMFWQYYGKVSTKFSKENESNISNSFENIQTWRNNTKLRHDITWLSYKNVISEAIFLYCGALSMCLWLMNLGKCHEYNECRVF